MITMDKFKEKTMNGYTANDLDCYCVVMTKDMRKLKKIIRRIARRKLKQELCKEVQKIEY